MTRQEMIEVLIEDRLSDWMFARNYDGLEEILWAGFKGYGEYTDELLIEEIELKGLNSDDIERLQRQLERRTEKTENERKMEKRIYKDPFE